MSKHFVVNPNIVHIPKFDLQKAEQRRIESISEILVQQEAVRHEALEKNYDLQAPIGKIIIKIDLQSKNFHTFDNGKKIRLERQFDNFNRRYTEPVNAIVVNSEFIEKGAEILIHPNAISEHFRIYNYATISGKEEASEIRHYSIPEEMCFCYRDGKDWLPLKPFEKALRIFKPYTGFLHGIEPEQLKDSLYVLTGELKGKAILTVKAADYQVIFQDSNGKEGSLIRFRPNGDGKEREPEAICILNDITDKINNGELLIGHDIKDAKTLK